MSNIRFLYTIQSDTATPTASTAATGYPVANLLHPFRTKTWRSTTTGSTTVTWDLSTAQSSNTVALVNHNLDAGSTIVFEGADDSGFTTNLVTLNPVYNAGTIVLYHAALNKRYKRLRLTKSTGAYIEIGRVLFGNYYEVEKNCNVQFSDAKHDLSRSDKTIGGQTHTDIRNKFRAMAFPFSFVTQAQKDNMIAMFTATGIAQDLLVSIDSDNYLNAWSFYGRIVALDAFRAQLENSSRSMFYSLQLSFEESI